MAIRLIDQYPNRVGTPDADYPHGVPRNRSAPGAVDGTPFEQAWFRDQEGFFQGLIETAGITPSGSADTVDNSDYLDALVQAMHGVTEVDVGGSVDVTLGIYPSRVAALRLTGVLGADVDLIVPDTERLYWIIDETTGGFSVTVRTEAGSGVTVDGGNTLVRSDGANVVSTVQVASAAESQSYSGLEKMLTPGRLNDSFKGGNQSLGEDGYQILPGGLIIQWGRANASNGNSVTLPISFPNETLIAMANDSSSETGPLGVYSISNRFDLNGLSSIYFSYTGGAPSDIGVYTWLAIGH